MIEVFCLFCLKKAIFCENKEIYCRIAYWIILKIKKDLK